MTRDLHPNLQTKGRLGAGNSVLSRGTGCGVEGHGLKDRLTECFCILVEAGDTFSEEEESLSVKCVGRRVTQGSGALKGARRRRHGYDHELDRGSGWD